MQAEMRTWVENVTQGVKLMLKPWKTGWEHWFFRGFCVIKIEERSRRQIE